jgi:hypothetical protein
MLNTPFTTLGGVALSLAGPWQVTIVLGVLFQPYPSKDVILARGRNFRGEGHDNRDLFFGDMIFANAVAADYRLRDEHCANFKPLIAHIERGIDDRTGEDNTGRNLFEERSIRYAAGGDAMLMSYCNVLNKEVRRTSPIVISD